MHRTVLGFWRTTPCGGCAGPSLNARNKSCIRTKMPDLLLFSIWKSNRSTVLLVERQPCYHKGCRIIQMSAWNAMHRKLRSAVLRGCPDSCLQTQMGPTSTQSSKVLAESSAFLLGMQSSPSAILLCGMWVLRLSHHNFCFQEALLPRYNNLRLTLLLIHNVKRWK